MSEPVTIDPLARYLPPDTAEQAKVDERNWFYESLSIEARERFLDALKRAEARGLGPDEAWKEAVVAAETTYPPDSAKEAAEELPRAYDPADKVNNL